MKRIVLNNWLVSAAMVALGLPLLAGAGLGATALTAVLLGRSSLAKTLAPWQVGLAWFAAALIGMWFLARFAFRRGGWMSLWTGFTGSAVVAAVCWFIGGLFSASETHPMARVGWGILAVFIAVYTVTGAVVGLLAGALETGRRAREQMEESP